MHLEDLFLFYLWCRAHSTALGFEAHTRCSWSVVFHSTYIYDTLFTIIAILIRKIPCVCADLVHEFPVFHLHSSSLYLSLCCEEEAFPRYSEEVGCSERVLIPIFAAAFYI